MSCPGNPPPPPGTRVWRGAVPAPLTQWAMDLRDHVASYPYGTTWTTTYAGAAATARKDYHTWTYRKGVGGAVALVTGICIPGITLYSPLPVGGAAGAGDGLPPDQTQPDPELAVYGADDVPASSSGIQWGTVAATGLLAAGVVGLFFLALRHAGRAAAAENPLGYVDVDGVSVFVHRSGDRRYSWCADYELSFPDGRGGRRRLRLQPCAPTRARLLAIVRRDVTDSRAALVTPPPRP